jgi:hypothetical protein
VFATDPMGSALVADLSVRIGLRQGLRPAVLRTLAEGHYLHDVGKVGIPDHILNKPGTLTGEERTRGPAASAGRVDIVGHPCPAGQLGQS